MHGLNRGYLLSAFDLVEMELHGFAVASRQHDGGAGSTFGTDPTKQISRLGPLIVGGTGA